MSALRPLDAAGAPPGPLRGQLARFGMVGACATAVHLLTLALLLDLLRLPYPVAATALGTALGTVTSYVGNHAWTFRRRGRHLHYLPRFLAGYGAAAGIHAGTMHLSAVVLHLGHFTPFAAATALVAATTFATNRYLVFTG